MTEQDISKIEREMAVALPSDYKAALLKSPALTDERGDDRHLFQHADAIIDLNKRYREGFAGLPPWPAHYFFIGDDGAANCYLLDLTKSPSPVFFAGHGNLKNIRKDSATLANWMGCDLDEPQQDEVDSDAITPDEFRKQARAKVAKGILGCVLMAGFYVALAFAGYLPHDPQVFIPAAIPFVYLCIGIVELLTGRPYRQLADAWMNLRGWQRGIIGTLIVLVCGFVLLLVMTAVVMWFT